VGGGYSFFGDSFVYILFDDGTTPTGRARRARIPQPGAVSAAAAGQAALGPDATGVGWIYQYALVTEAGGTTWASCARCRTGS